MDICAVQVEHNVGRVGKKSIRNWLSYVPDLIQDIYWEKSTAQKDAIKVTTSDSPGE